MSNAISTNSLKPRNYSSLRGDDEKSCGGGICVFMSPYAWSFVTPAFLLSLALDHFRITQVYLSNSILKWTFCGLVGTLGVAIYHLLSRKRVRKL